MNGIIITAIPAEADFVEVKLPSNINPNQFDAIMNRIKMDYFGSIKPKLANNSADLSVSTYSKKECDAILAESAGVAALNVILTTVGNPAFTEDWMIKFWKAYSDKDPILRKNLTILRDNYDKKVDALLRKHNLLWINSFIKSNGFL
jgi:hypothetical protein